MNVRAIILDFDGVVVESNNIKRQAFSEMFKKYTDQYEQIIRYTNTHNHVNRHDKFKYIVEEILHQEFTKKRSDEMASQFSTLTRDKIIQCPFVEGAYEFIKYFSSAQYPLYIASATPFDELKIILNARKLYNYFNVVYGAPMPKKEMFRDVIQREAILPKELLFIGDSIEDYKVAEESGISFIGRISDYDFKGLKVKSFKTMSEIKSYIVNGGI